MVPGWWWNGKVLRRKTFSRVQLKVVNTFVPLLRRVDRFLRWSGLSLIGIRGEGPRVRRFGENPIVNFRTPDMGHRSG